MQLVAEKSAPSESLPRSKPPIWWAVAQLTALAIHLPLTLLTSSKRAVSDPVSVMIIGLIVAIAAVSLYLLLSLRFEAWRSLAWTSVLVIFFWHASGTNGVGPLPGWLTSLGLLVLTLAAATRFAANRSFQVGMLVASLTLTGTIIALGIQAQLGTPDSSIGPIDPAPEYELSSTPDIYLVVLDGYGRADVINEIYGHDISPFVSNLESEGFVVPAEASSNYTVTHLALPSLLNMAYVHADGVPIDNADLNVLAEQVGGNNELVRVLKSHGYHYIHGETITQYNACGDAVDLCLGGPLIDVTMHGLLSMTPVGGLMFRETGDPATSLNLTRIDQMRNWGQIEADLPEGPTFTFLHLVLPHPPLYLDASCSPRVADGLGGRIMNNGELTSVEVDRRIDAWVEQVECANAVVMDFVEQIDDEAIVIVTADHGPDTVYRIFNPAGEYRAEQLDERLPTLTAVRMPEQCLDRIPEDLVLVNLFRHVLSCLSGSSVESLPPHHYIAAFGGYVIEFKDWPNRAD